MTGPSLGVIVSCTSKLISDPPDHVPFDVLKMFTAIDDKLVHAVERKFCILLGPMIVGSLLIVNVPSALKKEDNCSAFNNPRAASSP